MPNTETVPTGDKRYEVCKISSCSAVFSPSDALSSPSPAPTVISLEDVTDPTFYLVQRNTASEIEAGASQKLEKRSPLDRNSPGCVSTPLFEEPWRYLQSPTPT